MHVLFEHHPTRKMLGISRLNSVKKLPATKNVHVKRIGVITMHEYIGSDKLGQL